MQILLDTADLNKIRQLNDCFPLDGVTTNPTLLAKEGRNPFEHLNKIREIIGLETALHVQVIAKDQDGMYMDAIRIRKELGIDTYIKVPAVPEGFKAMQRMKEENFLVTATAIYTPMQAFMAAKCGADFAAPYVNRIENLGRDGIGCATQMMEILRRNELPCRVLAASFRNCRQVLELCRAGIDAVTLSPDILENLFLSSDCQAAVDKFREDFEAACGKGKTMADC